MVVELHDQREMDIPDTVAVKTEAADVYLIFSALQEVRFHKKSGEVELVKGRWCNICKYVKHIRSIIIRNSY